MCQENIALECTLYAVILNCTGMGVWLAGVKLLLLCTMHSNRREDWHISTVPVSMAANVYTNI